MGRVRLGGDVSVWARTGDKVVIHTDPEQIGLSWIRNNTSYEYIVDLTPPGSIRAIRTAVALPFDIVYKRIMRSIKNFAALFVASAFLAGLFLQLASILPSLYQSENKINTEIKDPAPDPCRS